MTAITKGTPFKYGASGAGTPFTGVVVQTYKRGDEFALKVEAKDAVGKVITRRWDDRTNKVSFTGLIPEDATLPVIGDEITIAGVTVVLEKADEDGKNDGYVTMSFEGTSSEGVAQGA